MTDPLIVERRVFTERDQESMKSMLMNHLRRKFPTIFGDLREDHFPVVVLEMATKLGDELFYALDYAFNELQIDTCGERENMASNVAVIGYKMRNLTAAKVRLNCKTDAYAPENITIPQYTTIPSKESGIVFWVPEDLSFAGETTFEIEVIEGYARTDEVVANGGASLSVTTRYANVADNVSVELLVDGVPWTAGILWSSDSMDQVYEVTPTKDLRLRFLFGDGEHGAIPPNGSTITIRYGTCSGETGNIQAGRIKTSVVANRSGGGTLDVKVDNLGNKAGGGEGAESVEEARVNAPLSVRRADRVISADDIRGLCLQYPGVWAANVAVDNQHSTVTAFVVATGYTEPPQSLLDAIKQQIDEERVVGLVVRTEAPTFVLIDIAAEIVVEDQVDLVEIGAAIQEAIQQEIQPDNPLTTNKTFGQDIFHSDLVRMLDSFSGVRWCNVTKLTRYPTVQYVRWHSTTSEIVDMAIGQSAVEEIWTVTFMTETTFSVVGSVSGGETVLGRVGETFITSDRQLSFLIEQGVDPNEQGDSLRIKVSAFVGNVIVEEDEFTLLGNVNLDVKYAPVGYRR